MSLHHCWNHCCADFSPMMIGATVITIAINFRNIRCAEDAKIDRLYGNLLLFPVSRLLSPFSRPCL
ncbi:hypothetical protein JWG39_13200 [Desulforhopalus vacuolatus]|uniref:hypothetical protein n=1 Tax=Desulforhopalus vacuolatus TaxID=40414 RepID=UPI001964E0D0|nr:hypothetical protein [Desulforhopalus vacuolatus]MBM9520773.1 hypothetical protein [Desulforhopalus vacuolatus]